MLRSKDGESALSQMTGGAVIWRAGCLLRRHAGAGEMKKGGGHAGG
jgi:hypothetical protein